jgi:GH25 family lysozyme M1 (1,4-beta-N-acetylmuramidase)
VGETAKITATVTRADNSERGSVSWTTSDSGVASVSGGTITANGEGSATITATSNDDSDMFAICNVTVKPADAEDSVKSEDENKSSDTTPLKDSSGNQVYVKKDESGGYVAATVADLDKYSDFYVKSDASAVYMYTGWQTIDGNTYFFDKNGNFVTGDQIIQGVKYHFNSDGHLSTGSGTMGIDVSKWNGSIDWDAVKNSGVSYVIIRCGYRGSSTGALIEDPMFRANISGAKAAGIQVGAYFFTQAVNEVEAVEEASMAVNLCGGYGLNLPIFLDVEGSGGRGDKIGADMRTAVVKAFCQTVRNSGYAAGVYANKTWFTEKMHVSQLTSYKIWLAQYAASPTYTASRIDYWQYSSKGKVSGIKGNVDMNVKY